MNRVAFSLFGIEIMWYAVIIMSGVLIALAVVNFNSKRKDFPFTFDDILDAFIYAFPLAIIGARIYYVIFEWNNYKNNLLSALNFRQGGLAIHGGIIGAVIGVLIYKKVKGKSIRYITEMGDAVVPGLILAQGIGRWGNFINQEAHGREVTKEFISKFPQFIQKGMFIDGNYYHPTFLYESIWDVLVFIILMIHYKNKRKGNEGTTIAWYMILYSLGRFFIEGMRTDSLMIGPIRQAQLISLVLIALGVIFLIYRRLKKTAKIDKDIEDSKDVDFKDVVSPEIVSSKKEDK